jgi:hypothetical protein
MWQERYKREIYKKIMVKKPSRKERRESSVGTATAYGQDGPWFNFQQWKVFLFSTVSRPALGST